MIEIINLHKHYLQNGQSFLALNNVSMKIPAGAIYGVIGRSGAGKSTLVRCMNFLEKPDSGQVFINDTDLASLTQKELRQVRRKMGMIFQQFNLLSSRTVFENIALPLELQGVSRQVINQRVAELLDLVELKAKVQDYPEQLSGGQKQRVAIARALATQPNILLSDEATSALDPETTRSILNLLKKINQELGLTIVLITHEMDIIKNCCQRVAVMENGEIVEEGTVLDIFAQPKSAITQRLTQASLKLELPVTFQEKIKPTPFPGSYPLVRLAFIGQQANEPLLANLMTKFSVAASILQADLEFIQEALMGVSICHLIGEDENIQQALAYLQQQQIKIEMMGYV